MTVNSPLLPSAEPEIENHRRGILERLVYDLSDGYQRTQAEKVMPWITQSREDVVGQQVEQFAFLSKLQLKAAFNDTAEIVRLLMLLGGRERLIYMNNVAMAASSGQAANASMWEGISKTLSRDRDDGRFLMGYNEDAWFAEAGIATSKVRKTLENLAVCYVHLFPRLMLGKLEPMSDTRINDRAAKSKTAKVLVEQAHQFCLTSEPSQWLVGAINDIKRNTGIKPSTFGGPLDTAYSQM